MPVFLVAVAALVAGIARVSPWVAALAVVAVTAIGVTQANWKAHAQGHGADIVAARAPGAILFNLVVYGVVIGLPYLIGVGIRSVAD